MINTVLEDALSCCLKIIVAKSYYIRVKNRSGVETVVFVGIQLLKVIKFNFVRYEKNKCTWQVNKKKVIRKNPDYLSFSFGD